MEDERVDDFVWQRILFVEENTDEQRIRTRIVHAGETKKCCRRVKDGDRDF
jgi:hypothetical protein